MRISSFLPARLLAACAAAVTVSGWDYEGHRMVNQVALASLPADFPAFVREPANAERIAFLSGEPDRWRNNSDLPIKHYNSPDHYLNIEQLQAAGLSPDSVSAMRYVFATQFAAGRAVNPGGYASFDPAQNSDRVREWPGFAPWAISEYYGKLKSAFSYLRAYEEGGTAEEIANARANIIYVMGVMGHYVGDCAQPLHTTHHHNGWVGQNPNGYTQWPGLHSWIDGGFIGKAGIKIAALLPAVTPAQPITLPAGLAGRDPLFTAVMDYILAQNLLVEPLYMMEKEGFFKSDGAATSVEGQEFIKARLLTGGQMLGALWITAWKNGGPDTYLKAQLLKRTAAHTTP